MDARRGASKPPEAEGPPRKAVQLKASLNERLATYALAAGAAGVGMLTGAQPAVAGTVFTHVNSPLGTSFDSNFAILDVGGKTCLSSACLDFIVYGRLSLSMLRPGNAAVQGIYYGPNGVDRLRSGSLIGPGGANGFTTARKAQMGFWAATYIPLGRVYGTSFGYWARGGGFLGLKFLLNGQPHYAWADLQVSQNQGRGGGGFNVTLLGYAYESCPNVGIVAGAPGSGSCAPTPEPGTLGLLALGALGLGFWRRRQTVGSPQ